MACTHDEEVAECADIMCDVKRWIKEADAEGYRRGVEETKKRIDEDWRQALRDIEESFNKQRNQEGGK